VPRGGDHRERPARAVPRDRHAPGAAARAQGIMNRRRFLAGAAVTTACAAVPFHVWIPGARAAATSARAGDREQHADLVICGGGLGGIAAALAACRTGLRVILTEETD